MKTLNEYITEKLFSKTTVEFVHHILDILYELTCEDNTNKNFGIKFDEIANNVGNHLYKMSKTLQELERGKYINKVKDGYKVLLTAYTENNTIPCEKSVEIDILIPNEKRMNKDYSDEIIKEKIFDAVKDLKKNSKIILMKSLQESILGSTKSGKNKLFADNPELHLKDIFASDELEMRLINGTKNKYTVYGSTPKKEIEIDESWPDIEITWLSITTNHGHQLTYKIKGQKSFDKFLSVFAPSGSSSEYLGSYHGIPSFDTKFIIENCTVDYDKLPLLAGVVKLKNVKFKMYSNHWESKIKGELHLKNCESELPPVLKGLSVFKKS